MLLLQRRRAGAAARPRVEAGPTTVLVQRPCRPGVVIQHHHQQQQQQRAAVVAAAAALPDHGGGDEQQHHHHPRPGSLQARRVYSLLADSEQSVGAEHGEGFVRLLASGVRRMDVEQLNESLRPMGALRLRHAQHPHEAFGLVFDFDSVVCDLPALQRAAWQRLAELRGLPLPRHTLAHPELVQMPPEVAVVRLLRWANDRRAALDLAMAHAELAGQLLASAEGARAQGGVVEWLETCAGRFNVPCALVSALDRATVQAALARMGLHDHFAALVASEDELETPAQRLLAAAIKLGRPPNMCVAFVGSPRLVTAAHNCSLKCVAVAGRGSAWRQFELKNADITCGAMSDLSVINLRRMFALAGSELGDLARQRAARSKGGDGDDDDDDGGGRRRRRITNAVFDEE